MPHKEDIKGMRQYKTSLRLESLYRDKLSTHKNTRNLTGDGGNKLLTVPAHILEQGPSTTRVRERCWRDVNLLIDSVKRQEMSGVKGKEEMP